MLLAVYAHVLQVEGLESTVSLLEEQLSRATATINNNHRSYAEAHSTALKQSLAAEFADKVL